MPASETLDPPTSDRFAVALVYAVGLHRHQARKGTTVPYASHLLAVASLVLEHGGSEDQAIAALLHDAIEDQGGPPTGDAIKERFGAAVHAIVAGCTDAVVKPKPPWRERKERYVAHVRTAPVAVKLVSAADKLHNARSLLSDHRHVGEKLWKRFNATKEETLWYYRSLVAAFREGPQSHGLRRLVDELDRVVADLHAVSGVARPDEAAPDARSATKRRAPPPGKPRPASGS
jgi:(p)ppGpp synthase/HD superfamily hydrolase